MRNEHCRHVCCVSMFSNQIQINWNPYKTHDWKTVRKKTSINEQNHYRTQLKLMLPASKVKQNSENVYHLPVRHELIRDELLQSRSFPRTLGFPNETIHFRQINRSQ